MPNRISHDSDGDSARNIIAHRMKAGKTGSCSLNHSSSGRLAYRRFSLSPYRSMDYISRSSGLTDSVLATWR